MKKTKPKYDFLSVRIENDATRKLDARAKKRGLSRSKAIREAMEWYLGLSDGYVKMVRSFANVFNIPESVVIENLGLETLARDQAEDLVKGGRGPIEIFPRQLDGTAVSGVAFLEMRQATWEDYWRQQVTPVIEGGQIGDGRERVSV